MVILLFEQQERTVHRKRYNGSNQLEVTCYSYLHTGSNLSAPTSMKWKNEIPNKTEFMKMNSFNFIANEKFDSELVHEKNVGRIYTNPPESKEEATISSSRIRDNSAAVSTDADKESRVMRETIVISKSATDFSGSAPKRYTTKCFIQPTTVPCWYRETLLLNVNSTKRQYRERVYFKTKLVPFLWSENMSTEVKTGPKYILSEAEIPVDETEYHYISLEPQQHAAQAQTTSL